MSANHPKSESDLVPIGKVGRPHGLRGAFFVAGREDPLERAYRRVHIGADAFSALPASVVSASMQGGRPVLQCSLAQNRDEAQGLLHRLIFVERQILQTVWAGRGLLWADVEGALVLDPEGQILGRVIHLYNAGASDVALVEREGGAQLDLPLIEDYVDLAPAPSNDQVQGRFLQLRVSREVFDDLWMGDADERGDQCADRSGNGQARDDASS